MNSQLLIDDAIRRTLSQLSDALHSLTNEDYKRPLQVLNNSSIGQHTRHVIEFFKVLFESYDHGEINYDKRQRDHLLELDKDAALNALRLIQNSMVLHDREMRLTGNYALNTDNITVNSTYHRELIYNLEHTIHHMAMIKIGIRHSTNMNVPAEFGVAASTMLHKQSIL